MIKNSQHEHDFVAEKFRVQEPFENYTGNGTYHKGVLEVDKIAIFCRTCGESRVIEDIINIEDKANV
jgi:hypothetical protein